jgi:Tol biopolymer transport system component
MPLTTGTHLGPYEIVAPIGAGGMGEVYLARDTKLNREVALKVLPEVFATDTERLARFHREAQLLASLNHPNIAAIYGLEESNGIRALVLELVEGPTLADRLAQGPIPLNEALPIARQIAEAVEAAHEKAVIHRDLKPGNIKLTPDGAVKVLDFGLAKLMDREASSASQSYSPGRTNSPTLTTPAMTMAGVILGTAAYMSPEQAKGKPVDRRADIWSFGVVFWEMLTGRRMYDGETAPETLARIIEREPDLDALPASTPLSVRSLLQRCLTKDPRTRLQAIGEARIAIDRAMAQPGSSAGERRGAAGQGGHSVTGRGAPWWALASVVGLALATVLLMWAPWRPKPLSPAVRVNADIGADASLATDVGTAAVLSPDGQMLAFAAQKSSGDPPQLYIRRLDQLQATPLAGTDDARGPFFLPDGRWIAFFAGGKLKKVAIAGGAAVTLCDAPAGRGGSWANDGTITLQPDILDASASLVRVSSSGGKPELLLRDERGGRPRFPQVLPAVLYTKYNPGGIAELVLQPLPTGERRVVLRGGYGRYLPSGHVVYIEDATLFAVAFDLQRLALIGGPVPVLEGVAATRTSTAAQFAVSENGTLVYLPGKSANDEPAISWMDPSGKTTTLLAKPTNWGNPQFSPDGRRLAVDIIDGASDVWIYEMGRDTLSRLTFDVGPDNRPVWTPDGRRVVFRSRRDNSSADNLYWQRADGVGDVQRLTESRYSQQPGSWHPSGKFLAFSQESEQTNPDIWILPIDGDEATGWKPGTPTVFLNTSFIEREPMFSPDGRYLAYESNDAGPFEVYVRPFPGPGGKWQVSTRGGTFPMWSRTRPELFFAINQQIMVAPYIVEGESFRAAQPRLWTEPRFLPRPGGRKSFDLHPDGNRVALAAVPQTQTTIKQDKLVFVFSFFDELRRIAPATKR